MYCNFCGRTMPDDALFCSGCGRQLGTRVVKRPLERAREGRKVAGVCMGFARYLDVDVTLVRVVWLALALVSGGLGLIGYVVAWIVMPEEPPMLPQAQVVQP
ncbi:MAG TPA: PspC domain-containing protein [Terriglobales bacterium]|nr:PspC domain-containing protein [Terriglobales bacterium]